MTPEEAKIEEEIRIGEDKKWCREHLEATNNRIAVEELAIKRLLEIVLESPLDSNICISTCEDLLETAIKDLAELYGTRKYYIEKLEKLDVRKKGGDQ